MHVQCGSFSAFLHMRQPNQTLARYLCIQQGSVQSSLNYEDVNIYKATSSKVIGIYFLIFQIHPKWFNIVIYICCMIDYDSFM